MNWRPLAKRKKKPPQETKREVWQFAYLDDVATQTLLATLDDGLATETVARTGSAENWSAEVEGRLPGVRGSVVGGSGKHSESEIRRRHVVESLFAGLRRRLALDGLIKLHGRVAAGSDDVSMLLEKSQQAGAAMPIEDLARGDILDVEVELTPPRLFLFAAAAESLFEMAEHLKSMNDGRSLLDEATAEAVVSAMTWFHGGTVPLLGESTSHSLLAHDGTTWLCTADVAQKATALSPEVNPQPLEIGGYCARPGFWEEPLSLFRRSTTFRALVRVRHPALSGEWTEAEHLPDLAPLGTHMLEAARRTVESLELAVEGVDDLVSAPSTLRELLAQYAEELEPTTKVEAKLPASLETEGLARAPEAAHVAERMEFMRRVEEEMQIPADVNVELARKAAYAKLGLDQATGRFVQGTLHPAEPRSEGTSRKVLEVHYVGIFW